MEISLVSMDDTKSCHEQFLPVFCSLLVRQCRNEHAKCTLMAPATLALFASGGQFHECVQYRIPTAKSLCSLPVTMEFVGLCAMHHMTTAESSKFAALCSALLHKDNLLALSVLDPTTGNMLDHHQLRHDPWYETTWDTLCSHRCRLPQ